MSENRHEAQRWSHTKFTAVSRSEVALDVRSH